MGKSALKPFFLTGPGAGAMLTAGQHILHIALLTADQLLIHEIHQRWEN
jgi:hypothetical protein